MQIKKQKSMLYKNLLRSLKPVDRLKQNFTIRKIQVRLVTEHKDPETQTESKNYSLLQQASSEISPFSTVHFRESGLEEKENNVASLNKKCFILSIHSDQQIWEKGGVRVGRE